MIDSRLLYPFVILAEELHFGRAAERLDIPQSMLSLWLQRLEASLGARLLERGGRSAIRLTQAGQTFLHEARAAVEQVARAERIGRAAGRGLAGVLTVGYVFSAAMNGVLPRALETLNAALPDAQPRPVPLDTPEQLTAIAEGRIDIGFIRPRPSYPAGVLAQIVHSEALVLAVGRQHRLARSAPPAAALAQERFIVPQFDESSGLIGHLERLSSAGNFTLNAVERTSDFISALALVSAGYGVALVPASLARVAPEGVVFLTIADHDDCIEMAIACRESAFDPLAQRAVKAIVEAS